jgi:hypothetical protein
MSFGLLKHFKESKSTNVHTKSSRHYHHFIIGQDLGAVLKLLELQKSSPHETVRLLTTRPLNRQALIENYEFGVSQLRSPKAVEQIYRKFHQAKISPQAKEASFYKEGKFYEFGGRAKGMDLLSGEDFFTQKGYRLELSGLFSKEEWENLDQNLSENSEIKILDSIEKTTPHELIDKKEWSLSFRDFSTLTCEKLYASISPKKFLSLINQKEDFSSEFIDFCTSTQVTTAISVTWKLNKEIYSEERTLFIPQSMTHEWGHFILEFENYDFVKKQQLCHVLFLIHDDEPQSEDLASKIKLMKRVLDRAFPDIEKYITSEYIRFDEEMFISNIKNEFLEQISFDYPNLKFIGQTAPIESTMSDEKFLARTLLN